MAEIKRFTAEEARAMMPSKKKVSGYEMLMNYAYRRIKGAATTNENHTHFNVGSFSNGVILEALNTLKEDGYVVVYDYGANRITINW